MSFVTEILCSAEKIEIENLNKKVPDILSAIDGYKRDVLQYIDEVYTKFAKRPKSNTILLNKGNELIKNVSEIEQVIDKVIVKDMNETKVGISLHKQELNSSKITLKLVSTMIQAHEILLKLNTCKDNKQFVDGINLISEMKQYNDQGIMQLDAFKGIILKFAAIQRALMRQLLTDYRKCIQYSITKPITLIISKNMNIKEILKAVNLSDTNLLDELVLFLWDNIFSSIINCKCSINIIESDDANKLTASNCSETEKDSYSDVFQNLILVIHFLSKHFNYLSEDGMCTLDYIGMQIKTDLSELIIKSCLADTIPTNIEELQEYTVVIKAVEHLQQELIKCHIFAEGDTSIIDYVQSIDTLYINKKCEEYLSRAKVIMKKDLHDMIEVGTSTDESSALVPTNIFPRCFISKSTLELIDLTDEIIQSAGSSEANTEKLYATIQDIFHVYGSVVEHHNKKLLQTIPQQVALFHNNCMYLSFKLSTRTETYQKLFVHIGLDGLMEKAYLLKQIGNKAFVDSLQQQIDQVESIIKESGLTSFRCLDKLEPVTEKSIRQCLRQQELLRTVWHKVLSHSDYNRSIGCILNYLCNTITNAILKIEDISSEAVDQLVDTFKVILTRGPKLFTDPKDIHIYVENWYRLNELVFILSSNLVEICNRWADGAGPLALQFKPEEVQKLIRALFQNTDRRAAVLARIVKR